MTFSHMCLFQEQTWDNIRLLFYYNSVLVWGRLIFSFKIFDLFVKNKWTFGRFSISNAVNLADKVWRVSVKGSDNPSIPMAIEIAVGWKLSQQMAVKLRAKLQQFLC